MSATLEDPRRARTPAEAASLLGIKESWLRKKAAARAIPCTFIGKHLRFSDANLAQIVLDGAKEPVTARRVRPESGRRTRSPRSTP